MNKTLTYEKTPLRIRTKTTKEIELRTFEKLSTSSIILGASKELYSRYSDTLYMIGFWLLAAALIWIKLG